MHRLQTRPIVNQNQLADQGVRPTRTPHPTGAEPAGSLRPRPPRLPRLPSSRVCGRNRHHGVRNQFDSVA